jgi:hypothetical protein
MATVKGTNVTKYDAGGSGDNIIDDGFIKTVEKVWVDSYTCSATIASSSSILIARIPKNKKVTDIVVHVPVIGDPGTTCTCYCCTGATTAVTAYFGALTLNGDTQKTVFDFGTAATLRLAGNATTMCQALGADTGIYLMFNPATTITGGTIRSIVRYT